MASDFEDLFLANRAAVEIEGTLVALAGNPATYHDLRVFAVAGKLDLNCCFLTSMFYIFADFLGATEVLNNVSLSGVEGGMDMSLPVHPIPVLDR